MAVAHRAQGNESGGERNEVRGLDESRFLFTDLTDEARGVKPSYYFMMRSLLHSRVDLDEDSDENTYEEDVNVYLAHLLQAFSDPVYLEGAKPYLHRYDHEVFRRLARATDARLKYKIYKTNADFLLVSIGIFDNPELALLSRLPRVSRRLYRRNLEPTEEAVMGRGRTYYEFAYQYSQLVPRRHPALTQVLGKLSEGFDRYTRILAHLRGEYMDIVAELSRGEIYHLERTVDSQRQRQVLQQRQDAFLDAYADWRRTHGDTERHRLAKAVRALQEIDPSFRFDLESREGRDHNDNPRKQGSDPGEEVTS